MNIPSKKNFGTKAINMLVVLTLVFLTASLVGAQKRIEAAGPDSEHCENGAAGSAPTACSWVNGNLNPQHSQWQENQFVAARAHNTYAALTPGQTVNLTFDAVVGGKHG